MVTQFVNYLDALRSSHLGYVQFRRVIQLVGIQNVLKIVWMTTKCLYQQQIQVIT